MEYTFNKTLSKYENPAGKLTFTFDSNNLSWGLLGPANEDWTEDKSKSIVCEKSGLFPSDDKHKQKN